MDNSLFGCLKALALSIASLPSWIYIIVLLATALPFEVVSLAIKANEQSTFLCMIDEERCCHTICLNHYNKGPNDLQGWVYHVYLIVPSVICITEAIFRMKKLCQYPGIKNCTLHFHTAYYLRLICLLIVHVVVIILLAVRFEDLSMESSYICKAETLDINCIDKQAGTKSAMSIACFVFTIILTLIVFVEVVVHWCKWNGAKEERLGQPEDEDQCRECCFFLESFCHVPNDREDATHSARGSGVTTANAATKVRISNQPTGVSTGRLHNFDGQLNPRFVADSIQLPREWDPMPEDSSGRGVEVHRVKLQPHSQEFIEVRKKFTSTSGGKIDNGNITRIDRVQNPQLYMSYSARKQSMLETLGDTNINELSLFHGTRPQSVSGINKNGFKKYFAGVNGTAFGEGVYFAVDSKYSVGYTSENCCDTRFMYLAKVLVGKYTRGHQSYKKAPDGFDSVVDDTNSPTMHVVFHDSQCYPEYLLQFTNR